MFIPKLVISPIDPESNVRFICNYLSPEKQSNKTRAFAEKTLAMYPELKETALISDDNERNSKIHDAVILRLEQSQAEINQRISYFNEKFSSFIDDFILAQCNLFNYSWKEYNPVINCYVGYIPFYPRSAKDKCFFVSYNDEERVFSGAVHEINHMIFYEKWLEMHKSEDKEERFFPDPWWFLEEIIVDPTLNDPEVKPYTLYENKAYDQFYIPLIENKSIMSCIKEMYDSKTSIESFLDEAYTFVCNNIEKLTRG